MMMSCLIPWNTKPSTVGWSFFIPMHILWLRLLLRSVNGGCRRPDQFGQVSTSVCSSQALLASMGRRVDDGKRLTDSTPCLLALSLEPKMAFNEHLTLFEEACMYWRMGKEACWISLTYLMGKSVFLHASWAWFVGVFGACGLDQGEHKTPITVTILVHSTSQLMRITTSILTLTTKAWKREKKKKE